MDFCQPLPKVATWVNYIAQFWFARYIYLEGDQDEARRIFNGLANANIETETKREPRGIVIEAGQPKRFSGTIKNLQIYVAFILRDGLQDTVFAFNKYSNETEWNKLKQNKRVTFELAFNFRGPSALKIHAE